MSFSPSPSSSTTTTIGSLDTKPSILENYLDQQDFRYSNVEVPDTNVTCDNINKSDKHNGNNKQRIVANSRERKRTESLNKALATLRNRLPVSEVEKKSKFHTLKLASEYISFLNDLLSREPIQSNKVIESDFYLFRIQQSRKKRETREENQLH